MTEHVSVLPNCFGRFLLLGVFLSFSVIARGQAGSPSSQGPISKAMAYEVVTIKPAAVQPWFGITFKPDGLHGSKVTIKELVASAYGVKQAQVAGGPAWVETERFDLDAKMDEETAGALKKLPGPQQKAQRQEMLQAVLADRFRLRAHRGNSVIPIYALTVSKTGSKLKEADAKVADIMSPNGIHVRSGTWILGGGNPGIAFTGHDIPISAVETVLDWNVDRIVVDRTGLTGLYDIQLKWTPEDHQAVRMEEEGGSLIPADPGPTIFSALEKQLGLRLEPTRGPMDAIVVDQVERPSEN